MGLVTSGMGSVTKVIPDRAEPGEADAAELPWSAPLRRGAPSGYAIFAAASGRSFATRTIGMPLCVASCISRMARGRSPKS